MWEVEFTEQFQDWMYSLTEAQQGAVVGRVEALRLDGPNLGRPTLTHSEARHCRT
jgi:hypothetical protein